MTLPAYAVDFRGRPACPCLAEWLPVYEHELQRRGILTGPLRIYQLIGGAEASAGTHSKGGAFDLLDLPGDVDVWVARQMGADATWSRLHDWDGRGGMAHIHGVLTGCPHNGPAAYQIDAVRAGLDGLARRGPDTGPRPLSGRTWRQGIEWAREQEDDMTPEQDKRLKRIETMIINQAALNKKRLQRVLKALDAIDAEQDAAARKGQIKALKRDVADVAAALADDEG